MQRRLKRQLVIGLAALAVVAFAGGAYAATQSSTPPTRQAFLNDVAKRLGVTPQQLTAALNGATVDQLQAEVKAGRLTQAQANALAQSLKQNGNAAALPFGLGLGLGRFFAPPGAPGWGPAGPGGPAGPAGPPWIPGGKGGLGGFRGHLIGPFAGAIDLSATASYLGLTNAQVFQQLARGKSLAQIATAKGKTVSGLEQAITSALKTRLDKLVSKKAITAAQETQILNRFTARLSQAVNQKGLAFPRPAFRFRYGLPPGPPGAAPKSPNMPIPVPPAYAPAPAVPAPTA